MDLPPRGGPFLPNVRLPPGSSPMRHRLPPPGMGQRPPHLMGFPPPGPRLPGPGPRFPGAGPPPRLPGGWVACFAPDGREYWFHPPTNVTTWEKPEEIMSSYEKVLAQCPWKESKTESGRIYYYNSVTNESEWIKPTELINAEKDAKAVEDLEKQGVHLPPAREAAPDIPLPGDSAEFGITQQVLEDREEAVTAFKEFLTSLGVKSSATWEATLKQITSHPRFGQFKILNNKKKIFNEYKVEKKNSEKEELRQMLKVNQDRLEEYLLKDSRLTCHMRFRKAVKVFGQEPMWLSVEDSLRNEAFEKAIIKKTRADKETAEKQKKQNIETFSEILRGMEDIKYDTTWAECQQMLLHCTQFLLNESVKNMDKEDALKCFEDYIADLELLHDEDIEKDKLKRRRTQRKNREAFLVLLEELHDKSLLTSISRWDDLYLTISRDERFHTMLGQPGCTPLDLFKFYIEELKSYYSNEKKVIIEILKEKGTLIEPSTTFEDFADLISSDKRCLTLDAGNIKLVYNALIDKASSRERQRLKEEAKQMRKIESAFRSLLKRCEPLKGAIHQAEGSRPQWKDIRPFLEESKEFKMVSTEAERVKLFSEYLEVLEEVVQHKSSKKHSKKSKHRRHRKRKRSRSYSDGSSDEDSSGGEQGYSDSGSDRSDRKSSKKHRKSSKKHRHYSPDPGSESGEVSN